MKWEKTPSKRHLLKGIWKSLHFKRIIEAMSMDFNVVCCTLTVLSHLQIPFYQKCPIQDSMPMSIVPGSISSVLHALSNYILTVAQQVLLFAF